MFTQGRSQWPKFLKSLPNLNAQFEFRIFDSGPSGKKMLFSGFELKEIVEGSKRLANGCGDIRRVIDYDNNYQFRLENWCF